VSKSSSNKTDQSSKNKASLFLKAHFQDIETKLAGNRKELFLPVNKNKYKQAGAELCQGQAQLY
jgi:hypothetical protein